MNIRHELGIYRQIEAFLELYQSVIDSGLIEPDAAGDDYAKLAAHLIADGLLEDPDAKAREAIRAEARAERALNPEYGS